MSEVIFAQAIRSFFESDEAVEWGLGAFSDSNISRALVAFHKSPAENWTVQNLAQAAGMSRTSFAVQLHKSMNMTPMEYATSWRIQLAKRVLQEAGASLAEAAKKAGYASDSSFARLF